MSVRGGRLGHGPRLAPAARWNMLPAVFAGLNRRPARARVTVGTGSAFEIPVPVTPTAALAAGRGAAGSRE